MAKSFSFDVVCRLDLNEVRNAVNLAQKEIATRYDFKNSISKVTLDDEGITLVSDNEGKLRAVVELLQEKLVRRSVPLKGLVYGKVEAALGGTVRQHVTLANGIMAQRASAGGGLELVAQRPSGPAVAPSRSKPPKIWSLFLTGAIASIVSLRTKSFSPGAGSEDPALAEGHHFAG